MKTPATQADIQLGNEAPLLHKGACYMVIPGIVCFRPHVTF